MLGLLGLGHIGGHSLGRRKRRVIELSDYFHGDVPVTRAMTQPEVATNYEANTGAVIVEAFRVANISPEAVPAVLVANHAPFTWGPDAAKAIENARILEFVAQMDWRA